MVALLILFALVVPFPLGIGSGSVGWETALSVHVKLKNVVFLCLFVAFWPPLLRVCGMYKASANRSFVRILEKATLSCGIGAVLIALFTLVTDSTARPLPTMVGFWFVASIATAALHWLIQGGTQVARRAQPRNVLVVGSSPRAVMHATTLEEEAGCEVVGFVDDTWNGADPLAVDKRLGGLDELEQILMRTVVDEVVVALPVKSYYGEIQRAIRACENHGIESKCIVDYFQPTLALPKIASSGDVPAVAMVMVSDDARRLVKRAVDLCCAGAAVVILSPVFAAIAIAVKLTSPGPILFAQERYGYQKRRFKMYKFRSMVSDAERVMQQLEHLNEAEGPVFKIRDDPRITPLGRFLRKTSLDELPQLFNVIKGEMSIVGPRPLSVRDVSRFDEPWLMRRFSVLPGLTCIWQVSGRSNLSFEQWISLDLEYIDNWNLMLDWEIMARTVPAVLRREGAV